MDPHKKKHAVVVMTQDAIVQTKFSVDPERVRNPLRAMLSLENDLEWLKSAGFDEVDCSWKDMQRAVIMGIEHQL